MEPNSDISIKILHSFYSSERDVYSRMVFKLDIDPSMAMKIVAFWLWLQETANTDIIRRVKAFTDPGLLAVSALGENYLRGAGESILNGTSNSFNERAISGTNHYLNKICLKAFDDIKEKAEFEKAKKRLEALSLEDFLVPESSSRKVYLSSGGLGRAAYIQNHHDLLRDITKSSATRSFSSNSTFGINGANAQIHNDLFRDVPESSSARAYLSNGTGTGRTASMQIEDMIKNLPEDLLTDIPESSSARANYPSNRDASTKAAQDYIAQMTELYTTQAYLSLGGNSNHAGLQKTNTQPRNELSPTAKAYFPTTRAKNTTNTLARSFSAPTNQTKNILTNQVASSCTAIIPYAAQEVGYIDPLMPHYIPKIFEIQGKTIIIHTLPNPFLVGPPSQQDIHPDERTLFVTFSNGWPLNMEEIYYFFTLEYKNDLERVYIEEPVERRDPQYAHVTFRHVETIFLVLGDEAKKKVLTNGKHLWARRFIPKKKKYNNNNNMISNDNNNNNNNATTSNNNNNNN